MDPEEQPNPQDNPEGGLPLTPDNHPPVQVEPDQDHGNQGIEEPLLNDKD